MGKVAIYTVLTGGYDTLEQPKVIDERFDYFCFSNDIEKDSIGIWKVRKFEGDFPSKQIESRYPKMHPSTVLPEYGYSVYMDANIRIETADFYEAVMQKIDAGIELSGVKHPFRNVSALMALNTALVQAIIIRCVVSPSVMFRPMSTTTKVSEKSPSPNSEFALILFTMG